MSPSAEEVPSVHCDVAAPIQLPFEVDAAVLEQVAEFRRQQQASLELAGPGTETTDTDTGKGGGGGETKIDF
ncbi:MAG: hypothetical protein ACJ0GR_04140 [Prochlorococcaceae cyanobacterium]